MTIELKIMTWNHPRGIEPMKATFKAFQKNHPEVEAHWSTRSLKDFEDYPIEALAKEFDLILLDHPCIGRAVNTDSLLSLSEYLPKEYVEDLKANSVGPSYESYLWKERLWALPVDTAAQVAAYRQDLIEKHQMSIPESWKDVVMMAKQVPNDVKIGIPLNSTHSFISFMTLCANIGGNVFWDQQRGIDIEIGKQALHSLNEIIPYVHPLSLHSDPIEMLEFMKTADEIIYVPLIYGYVNYSYNNDKSHVIHFTDIPSIQSQPKGSIIGGVGLGVSSHCRHTDIAVKYAMYVASGECQRGIYVEHEGQPAHRTAWTNKAINDKVHGFFKNTLKTLDLSYIRPRYDGYTFIQEKAGEYIHEYLGGKLTATDTIQVINKLIKNSYVI